MAIIQPHQQFLTHYSDFRFTTRRFTWSHKINMSGGHYPLQDRERPLSMHINSAGLNSLFGGGLRTCPLSSSALFQVHIACSHLSILLPSPNKTKRALLLSLSLVFCLFLMNTYVRTQGRPSQNFPQWAVDYFEFKLLDKQLVQEGHIDPLNTEFHSPLRRVPSLTGGGGG